MWNKKFVYFLNYLKCTKTIRGLTHRNKIKKSRWQHLPFSKSLYSYHCRDSNHALFIFVYKEGVSGVISIGKWGFWAKKHTMEKPKFPNLLILEHLKSHFIKPQFTK